MQSRPDSLNRAIRPRLVRKKTYQIPRDNAALFHKFKWYINNMDFPALVKLLRPRVKLAEIRKNTKSRALLSILLTQEQQKAPIDNDTSRSPPIGRI